MDKIQRQPILLQLRHQNNNFRIKHYKRLSCLSLHSTNICRLNFWFHLHNILVRHPNRSKIHQLKMIMNCWSLCVHRIYFQGYSLHDIHLFNKRNYQILLHQYTTPHHLHNQNHNQKYNPNTYQHQTDLWVQNCRNIFKTILSSYLIFRLTNQ